MKFLDKKNINFYIVSHKTKYPYYGEKKNYTIYQKNGWMNLFLTKKIDFERNIRFFFETTEKKN